MLTSKKALIGLLLCVGFADVLLAVCTSPAPPINKKRGANTWRFSIDAYFLDDGAVYMNPEFSSYNCIEQGLMEWNGKGGIQFSTTTPNPPNLIVGATPSEGQFGAAGGSNASGTAGAIAVPRDISLQSGFNCTRIKKLLAHEAGHVFSLGHVVNNNPSDPSIMQPAKAAPYNGIDDLPETPNCADIEAVGRASTFEGPAQDFQGDLGGPAGCGVDAWSDSSGCCHPSYQAFAIAVGHLNFKPASHIYWPPNNSLYAAGSTIPVYLHHMDLDGSVYRVDWYANSSPVATSYSPPFTLTASNVAAGTYNVEAVAYDTAQEYTISETTTINVCGPPAAPTGLWGYASGGYVYIYWNAAFANGYQVEAGTAPGLTNVGAWGVGTTSFSGPAPTGTYYIRVRSNHSICGLGPPSSDITIVVP